MKMFMRFGSNLNNDMEDNEDMIEDIED